MHQIEFLHVHSALRRRKHGRVVVIPRFAHGVQTGSPDVRPFETGRGVSLPWAGAPEKPVSKVEFGLVAGVVLTVGKQG